MYRACVYKKVNGANVRTFKSTPFYNVKFGLFGDIHFQDKHLHRINDTSDWIISEFENSRVDSVVCLGMYKNKFISLLSNRGCTKY